MIAGNAVAQVASNVLNAVTSRIAPVRAGGDGGSRGTVLDPQFGVDLFQMLVHRSWAQAQDLCDIPVGLSFA